MTGREVFPDEELRRRIMDFIMAAGQTLLENGAEVFRVEQTMATSLAPPKILRSTVFLTLFASLAVYSLLISLPAAVDGVWSWR